MASKISDWLEDRDAIVDAGYETDNRFSHTPVMTDHVHNPPHYTAGTIECIDYLKDSMNSVAFIGFLEGNAKKYLHRYNYKGSKIDDLQKAQFYLNKLSNNYKAMRKV